MSLTSYISLPYKEKNTILCNVPIEENTIKYGARLKVEKNYACILVSNEKVLDVFYEGEHILKEETLPKLAKEKNWNKMHKPNFKATVYYVSLKEFEDVKWGTSNPVLIKDEEIGFVSAHALGNFSFKVEDVEKFGKEIFGKINSYGSGETSIYLKSLIFFSFTNLIRSKKVGAKELLYEYKNFEDYVSKDAQKSLEEMGVKLTHLNIENVSFPEEIENKLNKYFNKETKTPKKLKGTKGIKETKEDKKNKGELTFSQGETPKKGHSCKKCGTFITRGLNYCPECGKDVAEKSKQCPECDLVIAFDANFCPDCGNKLFSKDEVIICSSCGKLANENDKFCSDCGKPV